MADQTVAEQTTHSFIHHNVGRDASNNRWAVSWEATETFDLTKVQMWMQQVGTLAGGSTVAIEVWDDDTSTPGSLITNGTSGTVNATAVTTSSAGEELTFTFSTPPTLTSGNTYYFVTKHSWTNSTANYMKWHGKASSDTAFLGWRIYTIGTEDDMPTNTPSIDVIKESVSAQNLTGTTFSKGPTFPTGAVTPGAVALTGTAYQLAPTFPTGVISGGAVALTGTVYQKAPTFPTGTVAGLYALEGETHGRFVHIYDDGYASAPDAATWEITGDIDLRARVALDAWSGSAQVLVGHYYDYNLAVSAAGALQLAWLDNTFTAHYPTSTVTTGLTDGDLQWVRATRNGTTGDVTFYLGGSDPTPNWSQLGAVSSGSSLPIDATGSADLQVGIYNNVSPASGRFYRVQVFNGIDTNLVFDADFTDLTSSEREAGSFTEDSGTGATVTITPPADYGLAHFPTGTVSSTYPLTGTVYQQAPTFPTGTVALGSGTQPLTGTVYQQAPTFPTGTVTPGSVALTGTVYQQAPTFPTGTVTPGAVTITGVVYQSAPTFGTGTVGLGQALTGSLYQQAPTFPTGTISSTYPLTGTVYQQAPTFPTGTISVGATALTGTVYQQAPYFPTGTVILSAVTRSKESAMSGTSTEPGLQSTHKEPAMNATHREMSIT